MFKMSPEDRRFIENKYHLADDPDFNPYNRMKYHGVEYPADTGLDDAEMKDGLKKLSSVPGFYDQPRPVAKAKLFAFVLDHARLDVNEHDWFVGFYNWGRPISSISCYKWNEETFQSLPGVNETIQLFADSGAVAIWPDFDHVIPCWTDLLSLGFPGLLARTEKYHDMHRKKGISPETDAFFEGIEISFQAILRLLNRYYEFSKTKAGEKAAQQTRCLKHLCEGAPGNLYEALQAMYLYFILCECVDHYQTRSIGNGFDSTLLPFRKKDLSEGTFTEEQSDSFIAYFLMQFSAIGNYWGHPMYLGGTNADGSTRYTDFSMLILDIYGKLGISNPKIQMKVNTNTPKEYLYKAFDLVRSGTTNLVFCCEPGIGRAMMSYGASEKEARDFELSGCYETRVRGNESSTGVAYVNALKAVELTFHDGFDPVSNVQVGIHSGNASGFRTFDDFYGSFLAQWSYLIEKSIEIGNSFEKHFAEINPSNLYSATIERCLKKGIDGYAFGLKFNNSNLLNCGFASAVDAVLAVKYLCYEDNPVPVETLIKALENNWEGYESLRARAQGLCHKYGNEDAEADTMAHQMAAYFSDKVNNRPNARGGVYKAIMHTAMQFVWQGQKIGATPDGRLAGEETSKNASPVNGMDRNGVTALIHSALALEPYTYPESFCVDCMLHPSAVQGDDGLNAMYSLVLTYLKGGGQSIQFNIFNVQMLRDAQAHPEKYRNLQVRVCGWNVLWNNLSFAEQNAYILRAENIRQ